MKKGKKYIIIFIAAIVIIALSYSVYAFFNSDKDNSNDDKDKVLSEVQYLENKFLNSFNSLNNIQYENYKISSNKISTSNNQEKETGGSSSNKESNNTSTQKTNNSQNNENTYKYNLELKGVLNNTEGINWDNIKNEIELIYTSLPTITLDLYQINLNKNDVLNFNKEYDVLTAEINDGNKEKTLKQLSKLYNYLPKFLENTNADKNYKITIKTKAYIFEAYSILDTENWQEMNKKIDAAINTYKELIETEEGNESKKYSINKCYIMLNELKNAVNQKNKEIFLIKYRNLLEEIDNI